MKKRILSTLLVLCMVLAMLPRTAGAAGIPEDAQYFGGSAYKIYTMSVTWEDAKAYCEKQGGHLASITSAAEQNFIEKLNSRSQKLWIGGYRDDNFKWFWVTGEPWKYTNWASGEPNDSSNVVSNENRVALWPKQWNDLNEKNKSEQNGFVCEWETKITVTFNPNGGTVTTKTKSVTNGSTYGTLPTPTRSGYKFDGWYTKSSGGTKVTSATKVNLSSNQTLYAHWTKNSNTAYTLTFDANGGFCTTKTKKVTANAAYGTLPTATRTGYTLSGWYTAKTGGTKVTSATKAAASRTLYAHWTKASRNKLVKFDGNGGDVLLDAKYVTNGSLYGPLPTPSRPGYHFSGWYSAKTSGTKVTEKTRVNQTGTRTLYAHWATSAKQTSVKNGTWKVTVPHYYNLPLYSTSTSTAYASYIPERSSAQTLTCTKMALLSNGTTRYYTKASDGKYYWFTYTCEMDVN